MPTDADKEEAEKEASQLAQEHSNSEVCYDKVVRGYDTRCTVMKQSTEFMIVLHDGRLLGFG